MSSTIRAQLEDFADPPVDEEGNELVIPMQTITGAILRLVLDWAEHHHEAGDLPPEDNDEAYQARAGQPPSQWDEQYLTRNDAVLGEIFIAASTLDIKGLVYLLLVNRLQVVLTQVVQKAGDAFLAFLERLVADAVARDAEARRGNAGGGNNNPAQDDNNEDNNSEDDGGDDSSNEEDDKKDDDDDDSEADQGDGSSSDGDN